MKLSFNSVSINIPLPVRTYKCTSDQFPTLFCKVNKTFLIKTVFLFYYENSTIIYLFTFFFIFEYQTQKINKN